MDAEFHVPEFLCLEGDDLVGVARRYLGVCDELVVSGFGGEVSALEWHRRRALMMDALVCGVWQVCVLRHAFFGEYALVATGGYGRCEVSLRSDLDLLFLADEGVFDRLQPCVEELLRVLWDVGLDVGHALRSLEQCREAMVGDSTVLTGMLEARCLCGEAGLEQKFFELVRGFFLEPGQFERFFDSKVLEYNERLKKYGGSVYVLEPNLKESEGGLRDIHLIRWLSRAAGYGQDFSDLVALGFIDETMSEFLDEALEFFLMVRNHLHRLSKKKNDQITFAKQEEIARCLGYVDEEGALGVERFMQVYYTHASQTHRAVNLLIEKLSEKQKTPSSGALKLKKKPLDGNFYTLAGKIYVADEAVFQKQPAQMMQAFLYVQDTACGLHFKTRQLLRDALYLVDESFCSDEVVCKLFRSLVSSHKNLGQAFFAMHEVHFFDAFIPEFRSLRNRVQHDVYHVYTVDTHSLFALEQLAKLHGNPEYAQRFEIYKRALEEVARPDLLSLGLLFHDIGKGKGGNHSVIGAEMANSIMERLGYSQSEQKTVEFLVLSHLLMPYLSQRRDLDDPALIKQFASSMQTLDNLNMLYVLTWADIRAVSAEAWTEWKGTLLTALYDKTRDVLSGKSQVFLSAEQRVASVREAILAQKKGYIDAAQLDKFLQVLSPRYTLAHSDEEILEHFDLLKNHDESQLFFVEKPLEPEHVSEVLVYTYNNPRLLPLITGVMLSADVNILAMENFVQSDGRVFTKLQLQTVSGQHLREANLVELIKTRLVEVFSGKHAVTALIAKRKPPSFMVKKPVQKVGTRVAIDNDVSAYYTVIDVFAHDRVGLLYDIVTCLVEQGCYAEVSKISTKVEQAVDSFYVKDIFGQKILSRQKLKEVQLALEQVVET